MSGLLLIVALLFATKNPTEKTLFPFRTTLDLTLVQAFFFTVCCFQGRSLRHLAFVSSLPPFSPATEAAVHACTDRLKCFHRSVSRLFSIVITVFVNNSFSHCMKRFGVCLHSREWKHRERHLG